MNVSLVHDLKGYIILAGWLLSYPQNLMLSYEVGVILAPLERDFRASGLENIRTCPEHLVELFGTSTLRYFISTRIFFLCNEVSPHSLLLPNRISNDKMRQWAVQISYPI